MTAALFALAPLCFVAAAIALEFYSLGVPYSDRIEGYLGLCIFAAMVSSIVCGPAALFFAVRLICA